MDVGNALVTEPCCLTTNINSNTKNNLNNNLNNRSSSTSDNNIMLSSTFRSSNKPLFTNDVNSNSLLFDKIINSKNG